MNQTSKLKSTLILALVAVLGLAAGSGVVWFLKNDELASVRSDLDTKNQEISTLKNQPVAVDTPTQTASQPAGVGSTELKLTDKQKLEVLTVERVGDSTVGDYWLPIVHAIHADYASTSPLPIKYSSTDGYQVPGVGGVNYFWHKKDGAWKFIGSCSQGPCQMEAGYDYNKLPKELTH